MMDGSSEDLVSRADIARLAGVRRPAVTNWERRHADFPRPVRIGARELFSAAQVAAWLESRAIPADSRAAGEPVGTTYADRFRMNLRPDFSRELAMKIAGNLVRSVVDFGRMRDSFSFADYRELLLVLLYVRARSPERWSGLLDAAFDPDHLGWELQSVLRSPTGLRDRFPADRSWYRKDREIGAVAMLVEETMRAVNDAPSGDMSRTATIFGLVVEQFSMIEGPRAGESCTPHSIVQLMVELLSPTESDHRIYDPYCRSGELLGAAVARIADHGGDRSGLHVNGEYPHSGVRSIAEMNLSLHGVDAGLGSHPEFLYGSLPHEPRRYDIVLTNPPFNMRSPDARAFEELNWRYGPPPRHRANFAWLQHAVSSLATGGRAAVLMGNGASFSSHGRERAIRSKMVEDGAVECLIALPGGLFPGTGIPVTIWVLRYPTGTCDEVLFIDARATVVMMSGKHRVLRKSDVEAITNAHNDWRDRRDRHSGYPAVEGFCIGVPVSEIRAQDYSLSPPMYVPPPPVAVDIGAEVAKVSGLVSELESLHERSWDVDATVNRLLRRAGTWKP